MKTRFVLLAAVLLAISACAEQEPEPKGDREVTVPERAAIEAAIAAEGCSGGQMKFDQDEQRFEVQGSKCADGRFYEIKLDQSYQVIEEE